MKIKLYTWILAGAYFLCGLMFFLIMSKAQSLFSEVGMRQFPVFTTVVLAVGPLGWLLLTLAIGAFVVLKDFRFHSRWLNPVFTVILAFLTACVVFALAVPWAELRFNSISA